MQRPIEHGNFQGGIVQGEPGGIVPKGFSPDCLNVEFTDKGELAIPRAGWQHFTAAPLAGGEITGLFQFVRRDGTWANLVLAGTTLYELRPRGDVVVVASGLAGTGSGLWSAQAFKSKLLLMAPNNAPRVYDTELELLSDVDGAVLPPAWKEGNWPAFVTLIEAGEHERAVAWGLPEDLSRAYLCALNDFATWWPPSAGAFSLEAIPGDGEPLVSVADFNGLLVMLKRTRMAILTGVDATDGTARGRDVRPFGCVSHGSLVRTENDLLWWSQHGPVPLSAVQEYGDVALQIVGDRIAGLLSMVDPTRMDKIQAVYERTKERVRWVYPMLHRPDCFGVLDYYPMRRYRDAKGVTMGAFVPGEGITATQLLAFRSAGQEIVLAGGYDGHVNRIGDGFMDLDAAIEARYQLPVEDFGAATSVLEADLTIGEGGPSAEAEIQFGDGEFARILPASLAPNIEAGLCRKVPGGTGVRMGLRVVHSGGDERTVLRRALLRVERERIL